jgi:hypothetical protein
MAVSFDDLVPQQPLAFDDLIPQQTTPPDPGIVANAEHALRMSIPFGNQIVAGLRTLQPEALGGDKGWDYAGNLAQVNAADARLQQEHPTIANLGIGTGAALSGLAVPSAALGEGAQGFGLAGRAVRGGLAGAGVGAVQGAGAPGSDIRNLPQTAEGAVGGMEAGSALGAAFPAAGWAIGKTVSPLAEALRSWRQGPADLAALGNAVKGAYKNVEDIGAAYSPAAIQSMTDKIAADAAAEHINPKLNPKAAAVIEDLQNVAAEKVKSGTPMTLPELDTWRQHVNDNLSGLPEPKQARFGALIKGNIDDFVNTAFPGDMAPMQGPQASIRQMTPLEEASGQAAPPVPSGPAPTTMLDFLRRGGGLQDEGGDLKSMGFADLGRQTPRDKSGRFAAKPVADEIIDKENGRPMDEGLRAAIEAGYMPPEATVSDFINKIGEHPTYSVHDEDAVAARAARDEYDYGPSGGEAATASGPPAVPTGQVASAQGAADAIANARNLAQRQFKAKALAAALGKAEDRAAVSGTGGNIENTTRQKLLAIRDREPWSPDEMAQLQTIIHGTPETNTWRQLGRFGPKGNALMMAAELAAIDTGHPALVAAGVGGAGAQAASAIARRNAQNRLLATILAGGRAPMPIATPPTRAAMAAALAANADLQARRNQSPQP